MVWLRIFGCGSVRVCVFHVSSVMACDRFLKGNEDHPEAMSWTILTL